MDPILGSQGPMQEIYVQCIFDSINARFCSSRLLDIKLF